MRPRSDDRPRWPLAAVPAAAAAYLALARRAAELDVSPSEERLFRAMNGLTDRVHPPVWAVMQSGSLAAVGVVAAGVRARRGGRAALPVAVGGAAAWACAKVAKQFVGRGRPADHLAAVRVRGLPQHGLGFPSGHTAVVVALASLASHDAPSPAQLALWLTAATTGTARVYVGAHLPLDVAGGAALGIAIAGLARRLTPTSCV